MFALLAALSLSAHAQDESADPTVESETAEQAPEPELEKWEKEGWGFGGLPAVAYNSDDGIGGGVLGSIYRYDGKSAPYKAELYFLFYVTSKKVHTHRLQLDWLDVGGAGIRLTTRAEFSATRTAHYCGQIPPGNCDVADAQSYADDLGLTGAESEEFVNSYYKMRSLGPSFFLNLRKELKPLPHRVEVFGGYWGQYIIPGDFQEREAFPNSLYDQDFPGGEQGMVSSFQVGAMLDNRDNEPAPIKGYWVEASVRGAHRFVGSDWDYAGFNVTARGYQPLGTDRVVLADRFVIDGMFGDIPMQEINRAGGSQIYNLYGGQRMGRGVRNSRVRGKARVMNQTEIRATVWSPSLRKGRTVIDITPIAFLDAGYYAAEWGDIGGDNAAFVYGTGGGLRLAFNKNFIIRADFGVSPVEGWMDNYGIYIDVRNLW
jgi:hypothetical protein